VLEGDNIVAYGTDPARVIQEARIHGVPNPYIFFVESNAENIVRIGL
jgi:tRNA A-37 threonylcarbamoyl transferase component Bud32